MYDANCWPVSQSGTENILGVTLMVFRGLQRTWPTAVELKILNFFILWMPKISTLNRFFTIFKGNFSNRYVPSNNLIPNCMAFFVVTGIALSLISCISSVATSPNLIFLYLLFLSTILLLTVSRKTFYAERHLAHSFPYKVKRRYNDW